MKKLLRRINHAFLRFERSLWYPLTGAFLTGAIFALFFWCAFLGVHP